MKFKLSYVKGMILLITMLRNCFTNERIDPQKLLQFSINYFSYEISSGPII